MIEPAASAAAVRLERQRATTLAALLAHPQLWRADTAITPPEAAAARPLRTGFLSLDAKLAEKGWPRSGLIEVICAEAGMGELRLLAPALAELGQESGRWIVWIDPPFIPYAPALARLGLDLGRILLIRTLVPAAARTRASHRDAVWSAELALKSGTCCAVLCWFDEASLKPKDVRRLKLAARQGGTFGALFRPTGQHASMADLRIQLACGRRVDLLELTVLKQRGGWPTGKLSLEAPPLARSHRELGDMLIRWRATRCVPIRDDAIVYRSGLTTAIPGDAPGRHRKRENAPAIDVSRILE